MTTIHGSERDPLDKLAEEFAERYRRGERPSLSEYVQQYPDLAADIRELFPALVDMEELRPGQGALTGPFASSVVGRVLPQLGEYRPLREVGRGGMGIVYEAVQESLGRHVALKVLPLHGLLDAKHLERFRREARAAARLHHSNIVPVFGVGEHEGIHYYAMQFIQGQGLDAVLRELKHLRNVGHVSPLPPNPSPVASVAKGLLTGQFSCAEPQAVGATPPVQPPSNAPATFAGERSDDTSVILGIQTELTQSDTCYARSVARVGAQVADALSYAHQQGILHRDVKPSNLLLDTQGTAWLTDFGLAKADDADELTSPGDLVGTLRYMAPERFEGRADARSDVYGLGVTLYELLTLRPAFSDSCRPQIVEQVLRHEPPRPRAVDPTIPRDLETVVLKAMAKDSADRYMTAAALAEDLRRFLADRPIQARRTSVAEHAWRWCRRNPLLASMTVTVVALLVTLAVGSTLAAIKQHGLAEEAERASGQEAAAREDERKARQRTEELLERQYVANAVRHLDDGDPYAAMPWIIEGLRLAKGDARREEMHRYRLAAALQLCPRMDHVWFHDGQVNHAEFSQDGRLVVTAGDDHTARVWDVTTGKPLAPPLRHRAAVSWAAFSRNSRFVVTASEDCTARVWEADTGTPVTPPLRHTECVNYAAFSADGRFVVTASLDATAQVWETTTGKAFGQRLKHASSVKHAAFSPDGRYLATASQDRTAVVWDTATSKPLHPPLQHDGELWHAEFSPDGDRLLTAGYPAAVLWTVSAGKSVATLEHVTTVMYAAFSPDGRRVVTASLDNTARVWDAATGQPVTPPLKHNGGVQHAGFRPDGRVVVTASIDGTVRQWDAATGLPFAASLKHAAQVRCAAFSPDGNHILTAGDDETARLWSPTEGRVSGPERPTPAVRVLKRHVGLVYHAAFSPDGRQVATAGWDGTAQVWDVFTGQPLFASPPKHRRAVRRVAFSPDGQSLATAGLDDMACVWSTATGQAITPPLRHKDEVYEVAFSPDGRWVVTASLDRTARVWDAATGEEVSPPLKHEQGVLAVAYSPDGTRLATGCRNLPTHVWEATTGRLVFTIPGGKRAWFSPNGIHMVTAEDDMAQVRDGTTGQAVGEPLRHDGVVESIRFSADGRRLVTASMDSSARVWDAATGQPVTPPLKHDSRVLYAEFSPDSRRVVTASLDHTVRVWDAETGEGVTPFLRHPDVVWHVAFSPNGRRLVTACSDQNARLWELPFEDRPSPDLERMVQVLAGIEMRAPGHFVRLNTDRFRADWAALWAKYPQDFPAQPTAAMRGGEGLLHYRRGRDNARQGKWEQAVVDLTRALDHMPNDLASLTERGHAHFMLRRWNRAIADCTRVIEIDAAEPAPWVWRYYAHRALGHDEQADADCAGAVERNTEDLWVWHHRALSLLNAGDATAYRRHCACLVERLAETKDPNTAYLVALTCVLTSDSPITSERLINLAELVTMLQPQGAGYLNLLAAVYYRVGQFEKAVHYGRAAAEAADRDELWASHRVWSWLVLALAHQRLGKTEEARQWLERADRWLEKHGDTGPATSHATAYNWWGVRVGRQLWHREAQALIGR